MRLIVAVLSFVITLSVVFIVDKNKTKNENLVQNQLANILDTQNIVALPSVDTTTSLLTSKPKNKTISTATAYPESSAIPSATTTLIAFSPTTLPATAPTATPTKEVPTPTPSPTIAPTRSEKININTADLAGLDKITGVGPAIAQRIIDYRNTNGPFQSIEEIKNVKGIGDITFEKMRDQIKI